MPEPIKILGIAGSLRVQSYNRAALRAAKALVPAGAALDIFELDGIPPFNQDEERKLPQKAADLMAQLLQNLADKARAARMPVRAAA